MLMSVPQAESPSTKTDERLTKIDAPRHLRLVGGTALETALQPAVDEEPVLVDGPDITSIMDWVNHQVESVQALLDAANVTIHSLDAQILAHKKEVIKLDEASEDLAPFSSLSGEMKKRKVHTDAIDGLNAKLAEWEQVRGMLNENLLLAQIDQEKMQERDFREFQARMPAYMRPPHLR